MSSSVNIAAFDGEDVNDRVAEFTLSEDRKTIQVSECCDYYFEANLKKAQFRKLLDSLEALYAQMTDE